ncbi:MAG: DUF4738 domain-containing protein [Bacteroidaceae bacterium]|nr:DUF4738 domain-containing protein [Bacteroidaceae bacterium]
MKQLSIIILLALALCSCGNRSANVPVAGQDEDRDSKAMLQGFWMDDETEEVAVLVKGDTIFYSDSTSMPAYFRIVGDSLVLASGATYLVDRLSENLFWFYNQNGDLVKYRRSTNPEEDSTWVRDTPRIMTYTHQVKTDSVVNFGGDRYHWYIAINPTKYKVIKHSYSDDGVEVDNVYYDNIMHISVYKGAQKLYSSDFRKSQFSQYVPADFLEQAVLGNMEYSSIDASGLHFNATLCIPDGASCYLVEALVSYKGQLTMKTIEY